MGNGASKNDWELATRLPVGWLAIGDDQAEGSAVEIVNSVSLTEAGVPAYRLVYRDQLL